MLQEFVEGVDEAELAVSREADRAAAAGQPAQPLFLDDPEEVGARGVRSLYSRSFRVSFMGQTHTFGEISCARPLSPRSRCAFEVTDWAMRRVSGV